MKISQTKEYMDYTRMIGEARRACTARGKELESLIGELEEEVSFWAKRERQYGEEDIRLEESRLMCDWTTQYCCKKLRRFAKKELEQAKESLKRFKDELSLLPYEI